MFYRFCFILLLIIISSLSSTVQANNWLHCKVVNIADGDTITCLENRTHHKIRLASIDAPERGQAFGKKAKNILNQKIIHQEVNILISNRDRYKRLIGTVYLHNENINLWMVRQGYAWAYRKYLPSHEAPSYLLAEHMAKSERRGIWIDGPNAIYPETYRKNLKNRRH